jgi:myo-inositol-1(or 4)-monophosphatase
MHPNVNYSIKLLRELGKKVARYFDDSAHHATHLDSQQTPTNFLASIGEKITYEIHNIYENAVILSADETSSLAIQEQPPYQEVWVYQTVCGYENFIRNIPFFCMTLTQFRNGQAQHAIIYQPITDEVFHASKGAGAQLNSRRLRLQPRAEVNLAYVNDTTLSGVTGLEHKSRILGSPNLELAFLAANRGDISMHALEDSLSIAAGKLIAREAGAVCFVQEGLNRGKQIVLNGHIDHLKKTIHQFDNFHLANKNKESL